MSDRLHKVAAVTGANRGLGKATAIELAKAGYAVVVGTRFVEKASETLAEIERIGGQAVAVPCDVTDNPKWSGLSPPPWTRLDGSTC